jgi:hypothetical protein
MRPTQFQGLEVEDDLGLVGFEVGGRTVAIEIDDFLRLLALPDDTRLTVAKSGRLGPGGRYGRKTCPAALHPRWGTVLLARILVGATETDLVRYRNGEPFDLRRANLIVVPRRARFRRTLPSPVLP